MSLHKLSLVTLLSTIVAFTAAGRLNRYTTKSETAPAVFVPVQSKNAKDLGAGKLLVASRDMGDPSFAKTVILLVHYDDKAVVGLVLNRRTDIALSRVLEGFKGAKDRSDPAYLGGPVDVSAVFALLQPPAKVEGAEHIFSGVDLISTKPLFEKTLATRPDPKVFHVYLGYAGWTSDQLRNEVELGAWFIFPGDTGAVFNSDPDQLWPQMIGKTELKYAQSEPANTVPRTYANRALFRVVEVHAVRHGRAAVRQACSLVGDAGLSRLRVERQDAVVFYEGYEPLRLPGAPNHGQKHQSCKNLHDESVVHTPS